MKRSASEVIAYLIIFSILFGIFASSYYFLWPLIKKTKSKSEIKAYENDVIELANKLSAALNTRTDQYMTFVVSKGVLSLDHSVFGIKYVVDVPYSPYTRLWFDIINNKPAPVDVCKYSEENGEIVLKDCLAEKMHAICKKQTDYLLTCYYPKLNVNLDYIKVKKSFLGVNEDGYFFMSTKPIFRVTEDQNVCSVYVNSMPKQKNERLTYYIICNIRKSGNTCYIPSINGNLVAAPVTKSKIQITYKGTKYLPIFNYFGCSDAYIVNLNVNMVR